MNSKRILVVDDERIVGKDIAESLESKGYEVCGSAMDGPEAIAMAHRLRPDLILMDIVLQGEMDGIEAACKIKAELGIPVVFLTAYSQSAVLERAKAADPVGYILKPFDDGALYSVVELALHKAISERVIREKGEWFHTTLRCIGDAVVSSDAAGRVEFLNDAAVKLIGFGATEVIGRPVHEVIRFALTTEDSEQLYSMGCQEMTLITRGEHRIPVTKTASRIVDTKGRIIGFVIVLRDDTVSHEVRHQQMQMQIGLEWLVKKRTGELEATNALLREEIAVREMAEATLHERLDLEKLLASISSNLAHARAEDIGTTIDHGLASLGSFFDAWRALVYEMTPDGSSFSLRHGWKCAEAAEVSRRFLDLKTASYSWIMPKAEALQPVLIRNAADLPSIASEESLFLEAIGFSSALMVPLANNAQLTGYLILGWANTDGMWKQDDIRTVNLVGQLLSDAISRANSAVSKEKLQAQLHHSQKVEAVGKLSAGLAHDFNNMLMPILGLTDLLLSKAPDEPMDFQSLNQIRSAAESAAALATQMLAFSRKQILTRRVASLNAVVSKIESMVSRVIGHDIAMIVEIEPDLRQAKIDIGQIEQILMNLSVNARAAMPDGGILTIRTANVAGEICGMNGPAVMLEIGDTGCGMSQEVIEQAFEPFFTTKGNQGTGLGLSVVKGIVEQHEGHILVDSTPGKGTWFHLFFPAEATASDDKKPSTTNAGLFQNKDRGRGQTVLIIEDEVKVASFLTTVLQGSGFSVTTAENGQDAMTHFAQADGGFDLVISDIILPDINGIELAKDFLQARPKLPVILSTSQVDRFATIPSGNVALLEKPYSITDLFKTVDLLFAVKTEDLKAVG